MTEYDDLLKRAADGLPSIEKPEVKPEPKELPWAPYYCLDRYGEPYPVFMLSGVFEDRNGLRKVAVYEDKSHKAVISTVFLGLNHNWDGVNIEIWETMIFLNGEDVYCRRCGGYRENAIAMHERIVEDWREVVLSVTEV